MPKTVPADVKTVLQAQVNEPYFLVTIELDDTTLYLTDSPASINFPTAGGNTYTPWGMKFSKIKTTLDLETDRVQVKFDNTDLVFWTTYVTDNPFQGRNDVTAGDGRFSTGVTFVSGHELGTYQFMFVAMDYSNETSDTVKVNVVLQ